METLHQPQQQEQQFVGPMPEFSPEAVQAGVDQLEAHANYQSPEEQLAQIRAIWGNMAMMSLRLQNREVADGIMNRMNTIVAAAGQVATLEQNRLFELQDANEDDDEDDEENLVSSSSKRARSRFSTVA